MVFQMKNYYFRRMVRYEYYSKRMVRCDYYFRRMLGCVDPVRNKKSFLNMGIFLLLFGFSVFAETHAAERQEYQQAREVINGVVSMYREDVELGDVRYQIHIDTQKYSPQVNASYSHDYLRNTGVFDFPLILQRRERGKIYCLFAAQDQGIVSHEAGHMVLYRLANLGYTSHANAFHEAFADLTSHFYRFHNPETRNDFLRRLGNGQGCVGDTAFTCVRNSRHVLTLSHVSQNEDLCEEHQLSRVFSNAVYDSMVTAYRRNTIASGNIVKWHRHTLVRAVLSCREDDNAPTLMDIAYKMLAVSCGDSYYRNELGRNFIKNQLIIILYRSPASYYVPNPKFLALCQ